MKMKTEHYNYMKSEITQSLDSIGLTIETAITECKTKGDWSDKAIRWYFVRGAKLTPFVCETLYNYLDDAHIDTALRRITGTK